MELYFISGYCGIWPAVYLHSSTICSTWSIWIWHSSWLNLCHANTLLHRLRSCSVMRKYNESLEKEATITPCVQLISQHQIIFSSIVWCSGSKQSNNTSETQCGAADFHTHNRYRFIRPYCDQPVLIRMFNFSCASKELWHWLKAKWRSASVAWQPSPAQSCLESEKTWTRALPPVCTSGSPHALSESIL